MADEMIRARRKLAALRRAEFRLRQRMDAIDFELDVLQPQIRAMEEQAAQGELPDFTFVEDE